MPIQQTYYLNCTTLATATTVFLDANQILPAPDGFYFDGTTARQQVGGVLLPAQACPTCGDECKGTIEAANTYQGVYTINFDAGNTPTSVGAVIIAFNVSSSITGIKAVYDGVTYNAVSSPNYGYLAGTPSTGFTYIGDSLDCVTPGDSYTLDLYSWDGTAFVSLSSTTSITVTAGETQITAGSPGMCIMVIPKTNPTERYIDITIVGPCAGSEAVIGVSCPLELPGFLSTAGVTSVSPEFFCNFPYTFTYYSAPVNGDGITLGLYDWVFSDINGQNVLPDGFYRSTAVPLPDDTFEVQDGVIIAFHSYCAS